jgi:hypothetical protein
MQASRRVSAFQCRRPPVLIAFCLRHGDLPLRKAFKGAILAPKSPESGEMSA